MLAIKKQKEMAGNGLKNLATKTKRIDHRLSIQLN